MTLNATSVVKRGIRRTVARNGLIIAAILYVLYVANELLGLATTRYLAAAQSPQTFAAALATAVPSLLAGILSILLGIAGLVVLIGAYRIFVTEETERLPRDYFTRNMFWAWLNVFVGAIVFAIAFAVGFVLFVIPAIFLTVSLLFWVVFVAVEDQNFFEGMRSSWALSKGHRFELLVAGIAVVLIAIVVSAVFSVGALVGGVVEILLVQAGVALTTVFMAAAVAEAYVELKAVPETEETRPSERPAGTPGDTSESV